MREKGFDQLPVLSPHPGRRLTGLITLGNCLSWISQGRASAETEVKKLMFEFGKTKEVVTGFGTVGELSPDGGDGDAVGAASRDAKKGRKFVEITLDTPLKALSRFFEWNSAAVVTEREDGGGGGGPVNSGEMKPVAVVTKVDLLTWLMRQTKV